MLFERAINRIRIGLSVRALSLSHSERRGVREVVLAHDSVAMHWEQSLHV